MSGYTGKGRPFAPREGGGRDLGTTSKPWGESHVNSRVVGDGQSITVESGGAIAVESGAYMDIESGGALKFDGSEVSADQMNASIALVGAMVGGVAEVDHEDDTSVDKIEVLAANESGDGDRAILLIVKVTETFAADTNKPIFAITNDDAVTYATVGHGGSPAAPTEGEIYAFAGELAEEAPLVIGVTDGTGGDGSANAGAIQVFAIALPADEG